MKLSKKKTMIGGLLALLFSGYLVFDFLKEPYTPDVSVTYLGPTNKIEGSLRAAFAIKNQGMSDIRRPKSHTTMHQLQRESTATIPTNRRAGLICQESANLSPFGCINLQCLRFLK